MKKQTKKEIWYWMIMGVSILILLAFAYAGKGSKTKEKKSLKKEPQSEAMVKSEQEPESESQSSGSSQQSQPRGGGQEPQYYYQVSGGQLGQSYFLKDTAVQDYTKESWLLVFLKPQGYTKLPRYSAQLNNRKIALSLSDTVDFDITSGRSIYQGRYLFEGKGVIKQVKVVRSSGNKIDLELALTKKLPFKVSKLLNPLRLVVQVRK